MQRNPRSNRGFLMQKSGSSELLFLWEKARKRIDEKRKPLYIIVTDGNVGNGKREEKLWLKSVYVRRCERKKF